jgi:rhamnogalacturonan hydrolase
MFLFKSHGGSGAVYDITLSNFIGHKNEYSLYLDSNWTAYAEALSSGVLYHDITFSNWKGTYSNGVTRGPIRVICPDCAPCYNIRLSDVALWTEARSQEQYVCESAYGTGACLKGGSSYNAYLAVTQTISSPPYAPSFLNV